MQTTAGESGGGDAVRCARTRQSVPYAQLGLPSLLSLQS